MSLFKRIADVWLNFSRGERNGLIILSAILALLILIRISIPLLPEKEISGEKLRQLLVLTDSLKWVSGHETADSLFPFDPNTMTEEAWQQTGLTRRQARTIINYRKAGGRFNTPEDLFRIYGLDSVWIRRVIPYIQIPKSSANSNDNFSGRQLAEKFPGNPGGREMRPQKIIRRKGEINRADTSELINLYGIGPVMARRIVSYRTRLGGFVSMEQLREVYGLRDDMYQALSEAYTCDSISVVKIHVNTASEKELATHPYLSRWNARSIIKYRQLHGTISRLDELKQNQVLPDSVYRKIVPYLSVE